MARDPAGRPAPASKIEIVAHANMAVMVRGLQQHLVYAISRLPFMGSSYDEIKVSCASVLRKEWDAYIAGLAPLLRVPADVAGFAEFYFAGISATAGSDSFAILTHRLYGDAEPWTAIDIGNAFFAPADATFADRFPHGSIGENNIAAKAVEVIEAQRTLTVASVNLPEGQVGNASEEIGLFAQVTTISKEAITTRIVHRWIK